MTDERRRVQRQIKDNVKRLIEREDFDKAQTILSQYAELGLEDPDIFSVQAVLFHQKGEWEAAIETVELGLKKYPDDVDLLFNKAYLLEVRGLFSGAAVSYGQLIPRTKGTEREEAVQAAMKRLRAHVPSLNEKKK